MTTEHLKTILDSTECCALFGEVATLLQGQIPRDILEGVTVGRMTALQKPDGGVRGIVVGDVRRLVARTLAQQFGPARHNVEESSDGRHC